MSLWDMLRLQADNYIRIGELICDMRSRLGRELNEKETKALEVTISILQRVCKDSGLKVSASVIEKINGPLETGRELEIIANGVKAELRNQLFLHIPQHLAERYESELVLSSHAQLAFPTAHAELAESSNCYALGRHTATVFHAMRGAEVGLWSLATELEISSLDTVEFEQWLRLIDQIESEIRKLQGLPKGTEKDEALQFYSDAAVHFMCFKDAYRTRAAHARATFDEGKSLKILDHGRDFVEALSLRLKE